MAQQESRRRPAGSEGDGPARRASGRVRPPVDHYEVEWQFDAEDLDAVESWLRRHSSQAGLAVEPEPEKKITDVYYDADGWRFYRAGYALRVRKSKGVAEATMKSLSPAEGEVRRRREISEPLKSAKPGALGNAPGPVGERARSLLGGREARAMFEVRTRRRTFALLLKDPAGGPGNEASGKEVRVGEVVLDSSEVTLNGGREAARLSRVEVEAGAAPTPELWGFVEEMRDALGLKPATLSKFETGLYAAGLSPDGDTDVGPVGIEPSMSLGGVAFAVVRRQFAEMRSHEPGTRLGEDPEELHDMRVATRRMRAAMKVFEGALPERAKWLREELRWLAGALGDVRDLDVQIEGLGARRNGDAAEAEGLGSSLNKILGVMEERRAEARGRMLEALDSERYGRLEESFGEMLRRGPGAERELGRADGYAAEDEPVTAAAPALISARYRKWRKAAKRLDGSSPPDDFHEVRKKGKKLRYALEFVSEVYGKPVADLVSLLKKVQDDLGDHQDAVVAAETLRELGTTTKVPRIPRAAAFAMGALSERHRREAADKRADVLRSKPLRALVKGKGWKVFEGVMEDAAKDAFGAEVSEEMAR